MDKQVAFDKALKGVVGQGGPSVGLYGCAYFVQDEERELRCAIGHVVSDSVARKLESMYGTVGALINKGVDLEIGVIETDDSVFLSLMQDAHDTAASFASGQKFMDEYIMRMREIASKYGLTFPDLSIAK